MAQPAYIGCLSPLLSPFFPGIFLYSSIPPATNSLFSRGHTTCFFRTVFHTTMLMSPKNPQEFSLPSVRITVANLPVSWAFPKCFRMHLPTISHILQLSRRCAFPIPRDIAVILTLCVSYLPRYSFFFTRNLRSASSTTREAT